MGYETDKRFAPSRFKGAPEPKRFSVEGRAGGSSEVSQRFHDASNEKMQYDKKVVCGKTPRARME